MELAVVAAAIAAFLLLVIPASMMPWLTGAALRAETIDHPDRAIQFEGIAGAWDDEEPIAA